MCSLVSLGILNKQTKAGPPGTTTISWLFEWNLQARVQAMHKFRKSQIQKRGVYIIRTWAVRICPTPECQEGLPSQGEHQKEEHMVVHHVQEEQNEGHIQ